jgi:hypothetical protein
LTPKPNNRGRLPRRREAVTMAVGFICKDGLVIAADRQITGANYTFQECKLHTINWMNGRGLWTYAGSCDTAKLYWQELESRLNLKTKVTRAELQGTLKEVLSASVKKKENFNTLLGAWTEGEDKVLFFRMGTMLCMQIGVR